MNTNPKRKVPSALKKLLTEDEKLTEKLCVFMNKFLPLRQLRTHHKALEITCHGLIWLAGWTAFIYFVNNPSLYQMQVNFYLGLILDIIFVALLKAYTRRKRPAGNVPDMFLTIGVDAYSFPSGHASRVTFIACFFIFLYPLPFYCFPPLLAWLVSLCISRILLKRHHILDILGGIVLGIMNSIILNFLWLSQGTCVEVLSFLSDKNAEETDFHV